MTREEIDDALVVISIGVKSLTVEADKIKILNDLERDFGLCGNSKDLEKVERTLKSLVSLKKFLTVTEDCLKVEDLIKEVNQGQL